MDYAIRTVAGLSLMAALLAALFVVAAGPLYRFAGAELGVAFGLLRIGVFAAFATLGLALVWLVLAIVRRSSAEWGGVAIALLIAAASAYFPLSLRATARSVPAIHDITTAPDDPPAFLALAPERARAPNGVAYAGPAVADQQREAYPEIVPLLLPVPPSVALERAQAAAESLGWRVVQVRPDLGRIEATARTRWWGFTDDVVVRVVPAGTGARVDIRSASRVGRSDLGTNAARIRAFADRLRSLG